MGALLLVFVQRTALGLSVARSAWGSCHARVARFLRRAVFGCKLHWLRGRPQILDPCAASASSALDAQHFWLYSPTILAWCHLPWGLGPLARQGATCVVCVATLLRVIVASSVLFP